LSYWTPTLAELTLPFKRPQPWEMSLEHFSKGIDNAHVDVFLSPRLTEGLRGNVRKLVLEEVHALTRGTHEQLVRASDLASFREVYVGLFEATLQNTRGAPPHELFALLQLSLLKCLLEVVGGEIQRVQSELKSAVNREETRSSAYKLELHEQLVTVNREERAIFRRVLKLILRQVRKLEAGQLKMLRASVARREWPLPEQAFFNPVLLNPHLEQGRGLASDYPVAWLSETGGTAWMRETNQCICKVFQHYLPVWTRLSTGEAIARSDNGEHEERLDQGLFKGFLETEMLLSCFLSGEEYRLGRVSWLDEPENLRNFLEIDKKASSPQTVMTRTTDSWSLPRWLAFRSAIRSELFHCLGAYGLRRRITLAYMFPSIRNQIGRAIPMTLVQDYVDGRLSRRRLGQHLETLRAGLDQTTVARVLDRAAGDYRRLTPAAIDVCLERFLVDFLALRRDLKLAYWTYKAMDAIRLIEDTDEVNLSRSNASLQEFHCPDEQSRLARRIRSHAVLKADLRGSSGITEQLRMKGLNPASHFSLNFFDPVNNLLPTFGAEKLFVEGDAVILSIFEYDGDTRGLSVARACGLAREILRVVSLQNMLNRKHGLPELELGLGIAFSPKEPNFLFDEGHRIMISEAINRADRLSACSSTLRRRGFSPQETAFRVTVLSDKDPCDTHRRGEDLLSYNVNGVRLEEAAFIKLQQEIDFRQVRLHEESFANDLFFAGSYPDLTGVDHSLLVRYSPVREWNENTLGPVEPDRRHFFEVVVDESLTSRVRKLLSDIPV